MGFDLKNKVVLVTGANRGIGKSIVEEAIARGAAKVYAAVRSLESANSLIEKFGDKVVPLQMDLSDPASIVAAANVATDVHIVINNAGVLKNATALDSHAIEAFQFEMDVNVYGLMRVAQAFAPLLKRNGGGVLVQLNSVASIKTFADFATYSASKAASYAITQGLRDSLREQGTHVVSVHPGPILTDMANAAGLGEIAEPPSLVATAIFDAVADGSFHVWPDTMAKNFGEAYRSYAEAIILPVVEEAPAS